MKHLKPILITITLFTLLLASIGAVIYLRFVFQESLYTTRDTIDYHLLFTQTIKQVPVIDLVDEEQFFYSCGDGTKPAMQEISYNSTADSLTIAETIHSYFLQSGYESTRDMHFQNHNTRISTQIIETNGINSVSILISW